MIRTFFLILFILAAAHTLYADDQTAGDETQDFANQLDSTKNPFEDGLPKRVIVPKVEYIPPKPRPEVVAAKPQLKPVEEVVLPPYKLNGVMVGDGLHEAIIDDQIIHLYGMVDGGRVMAITKQGVVILYKGKKDFLKVE